MRRAQYSPPAGFPRLNRWRHPFRRAPGEFNRSLHPIFFRNSTAPSLYPLCVVPHIFRGANLGSHTETQFLLQTPLVLRFQCICFYFNAPLSMHHIFAECHVPCTRQIECLPRVFVCVDSFFSALGK